MNGLLLTLFLSGPADAHVAAREQDEKVPAAESQAEREFKQLESEVAAEVAAFRAATQKINESEEYKKARAAGDREAALKLRQGLQPPDYAAYVPRFQEGARRYAGKEESIPFLMWLVRMSREDADRQKAMDELLGNFAAKESILPFAQELPRLSRALGPERAKQVASRLIAENPSKSVKAHAHYARAQIVRMDRRATDADRAAAAADNAKVLELAPGSTMALQAQAEKFAEEKLKIGMPVPDIMGRDMDGVEFKLSDYLGKVVVLDFWGDW